MQMAVALEYVTAATLELRMAVLMVDLRVHEMAVKKVAQLELEMAGMLGVLMADYLVVKSDCSRVVAKVAYLVVL